MDVTASLTVFIAAGAQSLAALRAAVDAAGLTVVGECASASDAIEGAVRTQPDVCVLERDLPGGAFAAAAAIAAPRRPPTVFVVGPMGSLAERRAALLAGATAYVSGAELAETLATARARTR